MANTTNYSLPLYDATDYVVESHWERLCYVISSALGNFLKEFCIGGVLTGWTLGGTGTSTGTVAAGTGLVNGCACKTTSGTNLTGLTAGATNYVYATTDDTSHTDSRTVDFTVSLSASNPANTVRLGSITVAAGGSITAVDDNPSAYPRDYFRGLRTRTCSGTENRVVTVGTENVYSVDHSSDATFLTERPSTVRITYADPGVYAWAAPVDGDSFELHIWNDWSSGYGYGYPVSGESGYLDPDYVRVCWERVGYVA